MDYLNIGHKIRKIRHQKGLTIKRMADATGFTQSYISMIELGKKFPTIAALSKIAQSLSVEIGTFFAVKDPENNIILTRREKGEAVVPEWGANFGYKYQSIAPSKRKKRMEPFIITGFSQTDRDGTKPVDHEGEELMYILEGNVIFYYGRKKFSLKKGDCVYFDSSIPHRTEHIGKESTKSLVVVCSPSFKE